MKLRCIAVDDESMARKLLEENIRQIPFLELVGVCKNPFEAMEMLQQQPVDLMFLLLAPESAGADHLKALARVSRLLRNRTVCEKLRGADSADAIYALLADTEASQAA